MKMMRKIMALMLAVIMCMSMMSMVAFAAGNPSITINPANTEEDTESLTITYNYYKILDASIDTDPTVDNDGSTTTDGVVAYYVTTQAKATALEGTGLFTVTKVDGQDKWYVELTDSSTTGEQIAAALDSIKATFDTAHEFTSEDGEAAETGTIAAGYYLITSSLGTKIVVQTLSPVEINEKNTYPTITKTDDEQYIAIGDTVNYTVTVGIPESVASKAITIVDTISDGLTMNTAVTVNGAVANPAYTSDTWTLDSTNSTTGAKTYKIEIPAATVIANKGQTLTFTYSAKLNENAVVLENETNTAHLEYDEYVTVESETDVTTLAFTLQKVDGTDHTAGTITELAGAEFELYDAETAGNKINLIKVSDGVYRVATSAEAEVDGFESAVIEAGSATINGLNDTTTYYLEETKAPTGYNKLTARISAPATATTATTGVDYYVDNNKGAQLPSTGGIGTTIFYALGGTLMVAAVIFFISKKRTGDME